MSAPSDAKHFLAVKGWVTETSDTFVVDESMSYFVRTSFFREGRESESAFRPGGATFCGRLSKIIFFVIFGCTCVYFLAKP